MRTKSAATDQFGPFVERHDRLIEAIAAASTSDAAQHVAICETLERFSGVCIGSGRT